MLAALGDMEVQRRIALLEDLHALGGAAAILASVDQQERHLQLVVTLPERHRLLAAAATLARRRMPPRELDETRPDAVLVPKLQFLFGDQFAAAAPLARALCLLLFAEALLNLGSIMLSVDRRYALTTMTQALRIAAAPAFVSVQNELSILNQGASDVVAWCEQRGTAFLPYFPLAAGLLTGKYRRGRMEGLDTRLTSGPLTGRMTQAELDRVEALAGFAESRGHTLLELAFGWLLASPAVASVIAGARSVAQVAANAEATRWRLTAADVAEVSQIARA